MYAPDSLVECNYIGTEEDGTNIVNHNGAGGLVFNQVSDNIEVRNSLISGNGKYGILGTNSNTADTTTNVRIHNNLVGTNATGTAAVPNVNAVGTAGYGINLAYGASNDVYNNVISGNKTAGISFRDQDRLKIRGNYLGSDISGNSAVANGSYGINDARNNTTTLIGGSTPADRNIISGNSNYGYSGATAASADSLTIKGNYFGCNRDCSAALPNGAHNIALNTYTNPVIGGSNPGEGNVVVSAGSGTYYGVYIINGSGAQIKGNYIGITPSNIVMRNSFGVFLQTTSNATIGGTTSGDCNYISGQNSSASTAGIYISTSSGTTVLGNYIGVDTTGTVRVPNSYGIRITGASATNTTIGGTAPGARNIISGNQSYGVYQDATTSASSNIRILGNYVGTDVNGNVLPGAAGYGIGLTSPNGIQIGGSGTGEGNVISGNGEGGLLIGGAGAAGQNMQIYGNTIGLKPNGETPAPNGTYGIYLSYAAPLSATPLIGSIQIGGTGVGEGNLISGNTSHGIILYATNGTTNPVLIRGNKIGVTASGAAAGNGASGIYVRFSVGAVIGGASPGEGNVIKNNLLNGVVVDSNGYTANKIAIRGNSINANTRLGIDLRGAINTPDENDPPSDLDSDTGANNMQNFPRRTTLTKCDGSTETRTVLRSAANTTYLVDFYANPSGRDPSGYGEGEQYIGFVSVTTDANGYVTINPPNVTNFTMTATDPDGNTSEFSNEREISFSDCDTTATITRDTTPPMTGNVTATGFSSSVGPAMTLSAASQTLNGSINTAASTWSVADDTFSPITDGVYDTLATFIDPETTMTNTSGRVRGLTVDTVDPTGGVDALTTHLNRPSLTGTVSEVTAVVSVTIDGQSYIATNNGDGTWMLPAGAISPALPVGTYDVNVTFTDGAGNNSTDTTVDELTVVGADAEPPTVNQLASSNGQPIVAGTYDSANSQSLRVTLAGKTYVLGANTELTVNGDNWELDLSSLAPALVAGTYDIMVEVTTRSGQVLADTSHNELTILQQSKLSSLAQTGMNITLMIVGSLVMIVVGSGYAARLAYK